MMAITYYNDVIVTENHLLCYWLAYLCKCLQGFLYAFTNYLIDAPLVYAHCVYLCVMLEECC